ncbi:ribonuclease H-like domain-containing protein [Candidatus Woesearchaeota archaeon]|nr:ribonuclease H-like domain-containing protein [Candidatus Woesearchaeota archaeon]
MLRNTFIHLPGIGAQQERSLQAAGITDWHAFLQRKRIKGFSKERLAFCKQLLRASHDALVAEDAVFFASLLPSAEHWRSFEAFKDHAAYLDIEISRYQEVTVVTITDGVQTKTLVRGVNLRKEELERALRGVKLIVTYNGAAFDIPRLQRAFGWRWKGLHVDLKTIARRLGYAGGLKEIEKQFGLTRDYEEKLHIQLKGGDPSLLYRMWRGSGDEHYLQLLLAYNEADAYHLFLLSQKLLRAKALVS